MKKVLLIMTLSILILLYDKVDALNYTQDIKLRDNNWLNVTNTSDWVDSYPYYMKTITSQSSANMQQYVLTFDSATENYVANYDLVAFDFTSSMPVRNLQTGSEVNVYPCSQYQERKDEHGNTIYTCEEYYYGIDNPQSYPYVIGRDTLNFDFIINYSGPWENNWSSCNLVNGTVYCPTYKRTVKNIEIRVNFVTVETTRMTMGILRGYKVFDYDNTATAINEQTQQQQQQHEDFMNSNQTYEDKQNTNIKGVNETMEFEQAESDLLESIDTNTSFIDSIVINPQASVFIWNIMEVLRNMNPAIILLMGSMLGFGIIKLVLNR